MKVHGYQIPQSAVEALERRMLAGTFDAFEVRRVLLNDFRKSRSVATADCYSVAHAAASRLIRKYATDGKIKKVVGTRTWSARLAAAPRGPGA